MTALVLLVLAADLSSSRLDEIKPRMQSYVDQGAIAGAVTLVQKDGKTAHLEAVGWLDMEKKIPMRTDTIFEIMSMTKPVTSVAIAMLAEEGRLTFLDPVSKYLREFAGRKETIRDLLTHTSGMPEYGPAALRELYTRYDWSLRDAVLLFSQQPPLFEPGTKWQYSNPGMATLGRIVEVVSGMPYEKFVEQRILVPLGMKDTFFFAPRNRYDRIATVYRVTKESPRLQSSGDYKLRSGSVYPMPESGLYSTAQDYAKFLQAMLEEGKPLLSPAMVAVMTENHTGDLLGSQTGWGLGWGVNRETHGFGHGGAFGTQGWVEPRDKLVRVFMVQKFGANTDEIRNSFANLVRASLN